ncbi:hypothetical protein C8A05DRAFT_37606 [Staphylotrichum tortipilum]|uniref:Uncharacterized protein n=1 Tax=Staphylotrichum tortipilum TaxID=2831512 RepID=A0AAN6MEM7_9PEZI|nr:hypothetical protein C8A05DRAFT_37606 [Staphylotrichum longicolle]
MRGFLRRRPNIRLWLSSRVAQASRWVTNNILVRLGEWLGGLIMRLVDGKLQRPILMLGMGVIMVLYGSGMALIQAAHLATRAGASAAYTISRFQLYCAYYLHHCAIVLAARSRKLGECVRFREIYEDYWY